MHPLCKPAADTRERGTKKREAAISVRRGAEADDKPMLRGGVCCSHCLFMRVAQPFFGYRPNSVRHSFDGGVIVIQGTFEGIITRKVSETELPPVERYVDITVLSRSGIVL